MGDKIKVMDHEGRAYRVDPTHLLPEEPSREELQAELDETKALLEAYKHQYNSSSAYPYWSIIPLWSTGERRY